MKAIAENIYERGKRKTKYVRRRIPAALRHAYPANQSHITRSLGTSDLREAKARAHAELAFIEAEFAQARERMELSRASLAAKRISKLSDDQLQSTAQYWARQVLLFDDSQREDGLDDDEFDELGEKLTSERKHFGRMLAQGNTAPVLPALRAFLYMCGLDFDPAEAEAKRASYTFLRTIVETLDHQLARQRGEPVHTDAVAPDVPHPLQVVAPERAPTRSDAPGWDEVFAIWREYVDDRPKSTTIAAQTPWRDLQRFLTGKGKTLLPSQVTPRDMTEFADAMRARGLAVDTINERISKIRAIYKIAVGKHKLVSNPAENTLGFKENSVRKRRKKRLPFDASDLNQLFGSEVFTLHTRSRGQSGEASYWIPLLMFYTGARPEEVAGLALSDIRYDDAHGWYFVIIDRPSDEDHDLFDDPIPESHRRTLKNAQSERHIPAAAELIELGLLRYVEYLRTEGETMLFPGLKKDWHGKLSGSFSKFFGRYIRALGLKESRKVLYSFRHTMKDLLEAAEIPSKYLRRLMGHTTGDGAITDGYGSDLPLNLIVGHFNNIKFPTIPALPWQPGGSSVMLKKLTEAHRPRGT
ncbi:integrase [Duganella sp. 1224]|uniref:site-specific integrase n=1 Tax=Duganella sp. 1224 TaxID=2587052 RepID=UPI0015CDB0AE|nr:site-specific integrase [Duganella sp. 1224]NYE62459.1 integrase [Duganella sp. 1224]